MKKKISSLLTIIFVLFAGVFATACGNKYKNFEFKVYYAFSADATEWFDGTDGISLNYDERKELEEGEVPSELIFNNGVSVLYIKVEVEGVKAKHIDTISISATALGGLDFSGATVREGEVVGVSITGTVDTTFKIYENNSGRRMETKLVVMKELAQLEIVDSDATPAMLIGQNSSLNLPALNNIKYLSLDYIDEQGEHYTEGETNQTGVIYTIEGIGKYEKGVDDFSFIPGTKNIDGIFEVDGGFLNCLVNDEGSFEIDANNHALKIRATSIFHQGTEEAGFTDAIYCEFYVCLASTMPQPAVVFKEGKNSDGTNIKVETVHLYQNGIKDDAKDYSASYINIAPKNDPFNVYTINISLYVNVAAKGQPDNFVKYDFNSGNNAIVSQAGLTITKEEETDAVDYIPYKIAIANIDLLRENKAKVVYEIEGLDFSCGSKQPGETLFNIQKHVVPKEILVNNTVVSGSSEIDIYYTTAKYDGVRLDIATTPNEDKNRELTLRYNKNITIRDAYKNLIATSISGDIAESKIKSGSTIYVKFNAEHTELQDSLTITTITEGDYDGGRGTVGSVSAKCTLNKVVTANSLMFVTKDIEGEEIAQNGEFLVNAKEEAFIYLKVNYSNGTLEKKSIKLTSGNSSIKFGNGLNEILLSDNMVDAGAPKDNGDGSFYSIFKIPVEACNASLSSTITVDAGGVVGSIVSKAMKLKAVVVENEWDNAEIKPVNPDDVISYTNGYAIRKGESATFEFVNADWVFDLTLSSSDKNGVPDDVFDYTAVSITKAADSKFIIKGNIANKTAIIKVTPTYYNSDLVIPDSRESFEIQIAVYDPIVKVNYAFEGSNTISYVNAFDQDVCSTSFTMSGKTAFDGTPTTQLVFYNEIENEVINDFSQVYVGLEKTENVIVYFNGDIIEDGVIKGTSGTIKVQLIAEENSASNIAVVLTPYVKGGVYERGETTRVEINIKDAIKSRKLSLSGGGLDDENKVINMSFMDVTSGGYDQKFIYAKLEMEDGTVSASVDKDVTYLIYKYVQRADGSFEEDGQGNRVLQRVYTNAVTVEFDNSKVIIKAYKEFGGGRYMLVLVPKDAYKGVDIGNITKDDFDPNRMVSIDLNVRDGSAIAPYQVASYNDLIKINSNITQVNVHYELTNNLDIRTDDFSPLGLLNNSVNAFQGTFKGSAGANNQSGSETIHTIYLNINKTVTSSEYGNVAGLFAMLGENAVVENLNLVVDFTFANSYNHVGALAGVNRGQINNVKVTINNTKDINLRSENNVSFGGVVGLNENIIKASRVEISKATKIINNSNANIGVIAGVNKGEISGAYLGHKESLENFIFDVLSNLEVVNSASNTVIYVGGVAGVNNGTIVNMLVGGKLLVGCGESTRPKDSFLGGVVGVNNTLDGGNTALIDTVAVLALDIEATASGVDVGGVAGFANGTINYAKYITAQVVFGFGQSNGQIKGLRNVAGIVANADGATIEYSSVESFVLTQIDKTKPIGEQKSNYPTIVSEATAAGLVAYGTSTVNISFVKGNIEGGNIYLLSNSTNTEDVGNCYFIGFADKDYINANGKNATYYVIYNFAADSNNLIEKSPSMPSSNDYWDTAENINKVGDASYSYLWKDKSKNEILMILAPQSISAALNQGYEVKPGSIYVNEFDITEYENRVEETILVNYFNNSGDEANTHNIVNSADAQGLVNITKIPVNAQTGLRFEIVGSGYKYAYINDANQIIFTGASGTTPILVRIYSIFNPDVESYVVFYSHILATEISLGTEEISLYTGMGGKVLSLQAENLYTGEENLTLFNSGELEQHLFVKYSVKNEQDVDITLSGSKLDISISSYNNIFIIIKDNEVIGDTQYEDVFLTLYISKDYCAGFKDNIELATNKVRVNLYNVASGVNITGNKEEMPTNGDLSFNAYLNTDYYVADTANKIFTSESLNANAPDVEIVDNNKAFIVKDVDEDCDAIKVKFIVTDGKDEAERLIKQAFEEQAKDKYFIDLFDITFIRSLHIIKDENLNDLTLGYQYEIQAELKDQFEYRYIESNITFEIIVSAESNEDATDSMVVTLKPTMATTLSFKTYAVQSLNMETDYTSLVTSENEEVLIIEPGKLGNIFLINIQPAYAYIDVASITSSELYVPSLNRNVKMMFTQLVYRERKDANTGLTKGNWTTTLGTNVQDGNSLELQKISFVNKNGKTIYNGIIALYVQVEGFSGLAGNLTATINVTTKSGEESQTLVRNKMLTTTYMPGVNVLFDSNKLIDNNRYYVQEGTSNNLVDIKIQGYQFNADPVITFSWVKYDTAEGKYVDTTIDGELIGDYVTWYLTNDKNSATYSAIDDSYTIVLNMAISKDMPSAFAIEVTQSLVGKDGAITTAPPKRVIFHPVDYFLNSLYVSNVNMEINQSDTLNLVFNTVNTSYNPVSDMIELFKEAYDKPDQGLDFETEFKKLFTYYKDGSTYSFADLNDSFTVEYIEGKNTLTIYGIKTFSSVVNFAVPYSYVLDETSGTYELQLGTAETPIVKNTTFNFDITPINTEVEILVRDASDIFANGQWKLQEGANYVLLNDITLEDITPITTKIKSFDGNNRIITVKSFLVNDALSNYGLFANLEQGTTLKNMMVDYSMLDTLALNNNTTTEVVFGGLVAVNNGGIIYNCDVINGNTVDHKISIVVSNTTEVVFGGLVGRNNGIITNSRVGRSSYTRIEQNKASVSVGLGGLTFEIFNKISEDDSNNKFNILSGGFVGDNRGTITTSYVSNTNLINHSNANTTNGTNQTAGFVARNSGDIQYSYVRADENTITYSNPYATGYAITNKGNGIVAGFVFENSGTISNSYANTELKTDSAYIAGFVYANTGTISESYAACTMNAGSVDSNAEQPFIGLNEKNELQSFGKIENAYYLIRSETDIPVEQGDKDIAYGLDYTNIQNSEYLVGFAFALTNTKQEREQGIWSYYSINGQQRALPELINADNIAHSYRYLKDMGDGTEVLTNVAEFKQGKSTNPYTISSAEEFNRVFKSGGDEFTGSVRFINNIDFAGLSVQTRTKFVLGKSGEATCVDGNGLTIENIYLEADETTLDKMGLFAEIENAYVKNLNLNFVESKAGDQFSTTTAVYSGGLAGKINDSVILNITLDGKSTTLTGYNFVGGLAGMVTGDSLIYGVSTNISVRATSTGDGLYYKDAEYASLNISGGTSLSYDNYLKTLSYAGGVAGVIDINTRSNTKFNIQYIDVFGSQMTSKQNQGASDANILAEYAGGVAGYAGRTTDSYRLRYFTGENERIVGDTAVGGIYGVLFGDMTACQVTADVDTQFEYDTLIGEYVTSLHNGEQDAELNKEEIGNLSLLQSNKYAGGLVGVAAGAMIKATYAKVGISSGSTIGGLIGSSISCIINYSYAIPYVDVGNIPTTDPDGESIKINIGGLLGEAHSITSAKETVGAYIKYLKKHGGSHQGTDIQFTYSTLIVDNVNYDGEITMDYIAAEFTQTINAGTQEEKTVTMLQSNASAKLVYVFAGTIDYEVEVQNATSAEAHSENQSSIMELHKLFPDNDEDVQQEVAFQDVFSAWGVIKYWSLKKERYFPLLMNDIVDNLIEIKDETDINKIINNPDADFIVVNDITIHLKEANWVVDALFTGTITGVRKADNRRPVITVEGLKAYTDNETMGFFRETRNAKITNLEIVWGGAKLSNGKKGGFDTNGKNITMISGLVCKDYNTLISNIIVAGNYKNATATIDDNAGYILDTENTITGFAGFVGVGNRTNVMGCTFAGKVNAKFKTTENNNVYVSAIAGNIETNQLVGSIDDSDEVQNAVITNSQVGVAKEQANIEDVTRQYSTTDFNLSFVEEKSGAIYVGGVAAYADNVGLNNNIVGGASYDSIYQNIEFKLNFSDTTGNVNFGGLAGRAARGLVSGCKAVTKLIATGTIDVQGVTGNNVNFGGLLGVYSQNNDDPGISDSSTRANFKFAEEGSDKLFKAEASNTNVRLSSGVAELGLATLARCLFTGEINTEYASITNVYSGSIAAYNGGSAIISEVNTYTSMIVGTTSTKQLYAGGMFGWTSGANVTDCANWDRIVPITSTDASNVYVGGVIGQIGSTGGETGVVITNIYTTASILTDSIGPKAISIMHTGAVLGGFKDDAISGTVKFVNVFYSSDLALTPEENITKCSLDNVYNYEASTILNGLNWHSEFISLNQDAWKNLNSSIPYLSKLEDMMKEYQILYKEPQGYEFREGSVFEPFTSSRIIDSIDNEYYDPNIQDGKNYNYYLLTTDSNNTITYDNNGNLNGIIIGKNNDVIVTSTLVGDVNKHSAISNVHIKLEANSFFGDAGVIVNNTNKGVIFNCSVQGTGISAGGLYGVLARTNLGMISHSYSGIELISAGATSGICANNEEGRLLSNYFTGYIGSGSGYGITQNAGTNATKSYMYNNYMAGVIYGTKSPNYNKVVGTQISNIGSLAGSMNYVDSYSDIQYTNNYVEGNENLIPVSTSVLMKEGSLVGNWYYTVNAPIEVPAQSMAIRTYAESSVKLNTEATTFGYNYNYPVYNFNKVRYMGKDITPVEIDVKQHLLYTGTGVFVEVDGVEDDDYDGRYNNLLTDSENYKDAFKISHLGVLSSVLSIVEDEQGVGKNFVFIYDIDGLYNDGEYKSVMWEYGDHTINGFETTTFTGIAVSHKYYTFNKEGSDPVVIKNISVNGLFNEVGKAYIGNFVLGSFHNLDNSGALAVKTTGSVTDTSGGAIQTADSSKTEIIVNNISFEIPQGSDMAIISGSNVEDNVFGSLIGTVYEKLIVQNYQSASNSDVLVGLDAKTNASAGLIAGACINGEILLEGTESTFYANIVGGKYVGGIVGELADGQIYGQGNTINIYDNSDLLSGTAPKFVGGVAGLSTKGNKESGASNIHNIIINIVGGTSGNTTIKANAFGGVIGEAQSGNINIGSSDLAAQLSALSDSGYDPEPGEVGITVSNTSKSIIFLADSTSESNYYGLTVGLIDGGQVNILGFNIGGTGVSRSSNEQWTIEVVKEDEITSITTLSSSTISDSSTSCGVGLFVGAITNDTSSIAFNNQEYSFDVKIISKSVPNVGGIIGLYQNGSLNLNFAFAEEKFIEIEGSTNVGGIIGYATQNIDKESLGLFASENKFAEISALPGKNIGGLIGKWLLSEDYVGGFVNRNTVSMAYKDIGKDKEKWEAEDHVENVGGVVGYLSGEYSVSDLINNGNIEYGNVITDNYIGDMNNKIMINGEETSGLFRFLSAIHVGGVVGKLEDVTAEKLSNSGQVQGYQNVGGLVGTIMNSGSDKNTTLTNCGIDIGKNGYIKYNGRGFIIEQEEVGGTGVDPDGDAGADADAGTDAGGETAGEEQPTRTLASASIGNVTGVINVGGAVGLACDGTTISKVAAKANVKGNANVGGLVGEIDKATLSSNIVGNIEVDSSELVTPSAEDANTVSIKGIYYSQYAGTEQIELAASYIPTSVGGLAGKATEGTYKANFESGILIESAEEGCVNSLVTATKGEKRNASISVDKNNMVDIWDEDFNSKYYHTISKNIVDFKEIESGYGGVFGSSKNTSLDGGAIIGIRLRAMLGVNVGTYYGAYLSGSGSVGMLTVYGDVYIDGAYNIGGIVGYVDISKGSGSINGINDDEFNSYLGGAVHLQSSGMVGINVGGLIGKTDSNTISNLKLTNGKIIIHTENNYNVGGVIGCAEVTGDASITELAYSGGGVTGGDYANNFGGLIGLLKVGADNGAVTVTVDGVHNNAFTINTIENVNYADGDSSFSAQEQGSDIVLYAEAFYINKDTFNICPTSNESYYGVNATNPTDATAKGWAKEYTGFKVLQRCIPKNTGVDPNAVQKWDAVSILYDAGNIKRVGTVRNLGLDKNALSSVIGEDISDNYICFTIYEEQDGIPVLYSRVGIASPVYSKEGAAASSIYAGISEVKANGWAAAFGTIFASGTNTTQEDYIVANHSSNTGNLLPLAALYYFDWTKSYYCYTNDGSNKTTNFQGKVQASTLYAKELVYFVPEYPGGTIEYNGGKGGVWFKFDVVYRNNSSNGMKGRDLDLSGSPGFWTSLTQSEEKTISSDHSNLPTSGSIFDARGTYTNTADIVRRNVGATDWTTLGIQAAIILVEIAIIIGTWGAGGALISGGKAAAHAAVKSTAKNIFKKAIETIVNVAVRTAAGGKAFAKHIARRVAQIGLKKAIATSAITVAAMTLQNITQHALRMTMTNKFYSYLNFAEPRDSDFGYLTPSYIRDIHYTTVDGKTYAVQATDDYITDKITGETYFYIGSDRPNDFHSTWTATTVESTGNDKEYKYINGAFKDIIIDEYTTKIENCKVIMDDEDTVGITTTLYSNGPEIVYAVPKYKYKNGSYYINSNSCTVAGETQSLTHLFNKGTYTDNMGQIREFKEPHYLTIGQTIYNSGKFNSDAETYSYDNDNKDGNLIYLKGGKYYFDVAGDDNDREVSNVEYSKTYVTYAWSVKPIDARDGYTWFDYAYYAAGGVQDPRAPEKYAKFGAQDTKKPAGVEGVDYITEVKIVYNPHHTVESGDDLSSYRNGNYYIDNGGSKIKIDASITLNAGTIIYERSETTYYRAYSGEALSDEAIDGYVQVYPYSFTNPYKSNGANAKVTFSEGTGFAYSTDEEAAKIEHNPTYYLWQGGYTIASETNLSGDKFDFVYIQTDIKQKSYNGVEEVDGGYKPTDSENDIYIDIQKAWIYPDDRGIEVRTDVALQTEKLQTIVNNWETYKTSGVAGYVVIHGNQILGVLDELYQVVNGNLYKLDESYSINDNKLSKSRLQIPSDYASQKLYVSNSDYGLYTRYKYVYKGNDCDFTNETTTEEGITEWKSETIGQCTIIPLGSGSALINPGYATKFSESCHVVLGTGENITLKVGESQITSGKINIKFLNE